MNKIKILPKEVANKIAAGEVVERPASVVKELVENSLDAGSASIGIKIEDVGRKLIAVSDDGEGMSEEDIKLACQRHATSKISAAVDLERIGTLGFRGEALASIAAVSFLSISSRSRDSSIGWKMEIEGGAAKNLSRIARTPGTTVEVRNLFFNTPARLKFLKSQATEMFHLTRIVMELSLAYPQVSFKLENKREEVINLAANSSLLERIKILLGEELAENLLPVSLEMPPLKIHGFISRAGFAQANRNNQYLFVNRRCVVDKTVAHAVIQGYHTFLPEKQYPAFLLFIETPLGSVDVNVHPAKREIRFRDSAVLHEVIVNVIKKTLIGKEYLPELNLATSGSETQKTGLGAVYQTKSFKPFAGAYAVQEQSEAELFSGVVKEDVASDSSQREELVFGIKSPAPFIQVHNTYLLGQDKDGVVIVDQHAGHERVLFDELFSQFQQKKIEVQRLLLPVTLHPDKAQAVLLTENKNFFRELGFDIEEFGGDSFAVHSYPAVLGSVDIALVIQNTLAEIAQLELSVNMEKKITQFLAPLACHSAVRANDRLSPEQITSLLKRLWQTSAPYTCPHGRPTIIRISWNELEKRFGRK